MNEWSALGLFILLFAPALGRWSTIAGIITIVVGVAVIAILSENLVGALGVSGVVCLASGFVYNKKTGEVVVTDILMYISGVVLLILPFFLL